MEKFKCLQKIDLVVLSDYILKHYGPMSHLKLQKLLFYCDAYCLAYFDKELGKLTQDQQDLILFILKDLSTWTGMELETSTHKEEPWLEVRKGCSEVTTIKKE